MTDASEKEILHVLLLVGSEQYWQNISLKSLDSFIEVFGWCYGLSLFALWLLKVLFRWVGDLLILSSVSYCAGNDVNTGENLPFCDASKREVGVLYSWYPWFFYYWMSFPVRACPVLCVSYLFGLWPWGCIFYSSICVVLTFKAETCDDSHCCLLSSSFSGWGNAVEGDTKW